MAEEPAVKRAMAFFDAQNLYQHAMAAFGHHHPNFDPLKLHEAVCKEHGWISNLVRFYTGVPDPARDPMWSGYWNSRILALKRTGVHVTTRKLRYREERIHLPDGSTKTVVTPQEKGIDVRLALDIVSCARTRQYDVAVVYSQDQDLAEIVQEVRSISTEQDRWIGVTCAFPSGKKATSRRGIDKTTWFRMEEDFYNGCIDTRDYRPKEFQYKG